MAEILVQLNLEERRLQNSVGILTFHPEFMETGIIKAVSEALPFDSIGGTTSAAVVAGVMEESGEPMLSVTVLTSDDVKFMAGVSGRVGDDPQASVQELYSRIAPPSMGKPSMFFMLATILDKVGADDVIES
ncbi:MAG: hypothetical protein LBI59_01205, partial [Candidatus Accumulibacter sp.]|nr:hypothetical protein [Accumulibacter sp.]